MSNGDITANELKEMVGNLVFSRHELINKFLDPRRDINLECGYPDTSNISVLQYRELYDRMVIATRVVEVLPLETWQTPPVIKEDEDADNETDFEKAWAELGTSIQNSGYYKQESGSTLWQFLKRADILSGIGHYGVILLGLDDGKPFSEPVEGFENGEPSNPVSDEHNLLYLRVFDESLAQIVQYETDVRSPRFSQPVSYLITLNDPRDNQSGIGIPTSTLQVHWSRIIHVADNLNSSEIIGIPRLRPVYNRILDLRKLYCGSSEMYWRGAFPGLSFETHPQLGADVEIDQDAVRKTAERYMNTLQRYIVSEGMSVKSIGPQVVDPSLQIDTQLTAISVLLGMPKRIFLGSERGELASGQDTGTWNERLMERQKNYITPRLIVPFVDRLIKFGVLPEPEEYSITWDDMNVTSELERSQIAVTQTTALANYIQGGVSDLIPPEDYLTRVLGYDKDTALAILQAALEDLKEEQSDSSESFSDLIPDTPQGQGQEQGQGAGVNGPQAVPSGLESAGGVEAPFTANVALDSSTANVAKAKAIEGLSLLSYETIIEYLRVNNHLPGQHDQKTHGKGKKARKKPTKSELAKSSMVRVATDIQRYSEDFNESVLADGIKGKLVGNRLPVDVSLKIKGKLHGIELKTITVGKNRKITMKRSAMQNKERWAKKNKAQVHTVVFDDSKVYDPNGNHKPENRRIFYRRGFGSFRVDTMKELSSMSDLPKIMSKKTSELSIAAGGSKATK